MVYSVSGGIPTPRCMGRAVKIVTSDENSREALKIILIGDMGSDKLKEALREQNSDKLNVKI